MLLLVFPTAAQKLSQIPSLITLECALIIHLASYNLLIRAGIRKCKKLKKQIGPLAISLNESNCTVTRTPNDWKLSEVFTTVLSGFDVATSETSTEAYQSISETNPLLFMINSKLQSFKLKTELKNFAVVFEKHHLLSFPNLIRSSSIHVTAMILDPRYKNCSYQKLNQAMPR